MPSDSTAGMMSPAEFEQYLAQESTRRQSEDAKWHEAVTGESDLEYGRRMEMEEDILRAATGPHPDVRLSQIAHFYSISVDSARVMAFDLMRRQLGIDPEQNEFQRMIQAVKATESIKDSGFKEWQLQNIARRFKRNRKELMEAYNKALIHQAPIKPLTLAELKKANAGKQTSYLVQGWVPDGVTMLFHGYGGTAKTLMMYEMGAAISRGEPWNGYPTKQGSVLVLQSDEPTHVTEERLETLGIDEDSQNFTIYPNWQVEQISMLEALLMERQAANPVKFIVVDSVTSVNRNTLISENDVEYARPILQLAALAETYNCTIVVIHHSNANGDARGTKALHNSVSEVWALSVSNEATGERLIRVQKNRLGRPPGRYKFDFDPAHYTFTYTGQEGEDKDASDTNEKQIELWLQETENRGIPFDSEEVAHALKMPKASARKTLYELWAKGMVSRFKKGRAHLYHCGDLRSEFQKSENLDKVNAEVIGGQTPDHFGDHFAKPDTPTDRPLSDQVIAQNGKNQTFKNAKMADHLITSPQSYTQQEILSDRRSDRPPETADHFAQVITLPQIGEVVYISTKAKWFRNKSDKLNPKLLRPSQKDLAAIDVNDLHPDLFHELIQESRVLEVSQDGQRVRVRGQRNGRNSVFNIEAIRTAIVQ
jgi:hypothetical protein